MSKFNYKKDPLREREASKYEHPIPSREYILDYLAERGSPATYAQILEDLQLETDEQYEALKRRLIAMERDGQILRNRRGAYGPLSSMELLPGRVVGHKDGFGFVISDDGSDDLFLSPRQMRGVFHGDRVLARGTSIDSRGRREAIIVEVLERNTQQCVGRFINDSGVAYVEPANQRLTQTISIPADGINGAENGQMVVAAITGQPSLRSRPIGRVIEVLGDHMAPGMETDVAIRNHELPYVWAEDVLAEANRFAAEVPESAVAGRLDLRDLAFVTIDGEDAKDFDDAVYCVPNKRSAGGWLLYVAIADVSHYVKPNTALDREAQRRGNSVYFPTRVIPMLPETLSNNLCSLKPQVDRLTLVCEMNINAKGKITKYAFHEAVIRSKARLTYNQVYKLMEQGDVNLHSQLTEVYPHLGHLYDLYRILHKAREARGAIEFEIPETKIMFDANRKIKKIVPRERLSSHRLIEELMLCANISAAKFLLDHEMPGLYRIHQGPNKDKLQDLRRFLYEMGLKMAGGIKREPKPSDYAQLLRSIKERPDARLIQTVLLRSMSQAIYSPDNVGHFGLAYEAYTHFTSPIRRYPDLIVHRAIRLLLRKLQDHDFAAALQRLGEHCSMTERRADDATDEVIDWLKCEYMMDKVGSVYNGTVSGVTSFGIFVELEEVYVEGLVHISMLPDDYYQFDAIQHSLEGEHSGRRFRLGDKVSVKVAKVNLDDQEIDFVLVGAENTGGGGRKGKTKSSKKGGNKKSKSHKRRR
jgi:ribonuclease R